MRPGFAFAILLFFGSAVGANASRGVGFGPAQASGTVPPTASPEPARADPAALFQKAQEELNLGQLDDAEHDFRKVLAIKPNEGGALANLGVV